MCARKKKTYRCRNKSEARIKLFDLAYAKGGYWAIIIKNDFFIISNYISKRDRILMDVFNLRAK